MKALMALGLMVVTFAACGAEKAGPEPLLSPTALRSLLETPTAVAISQQPLGATGNELYGSFVIPEGQLAEAKAVATERERDIFADGIITFAEYEAERFDAMRCLAEGGVVPMHYPFIGRNQGEPLPGALLTSRGEYIFYGQGQKGRPYGDGKRVWNECTNTAPTLQFYWTGIKTEPTESERQDHRDAIAACLRASGHDAPEHPSKQDLAMVAFPPEGLISELNEPAWFSACHYKANDEFAIYSVWHGN